MSKLPKVFPEDCKKVFSALAKILTPQTDDVVIDDLEEQLQRDGSKMVREFPNWMRWGFVMGVRLFEWLPFIFGFGLSRFSKLSLKHQEKYVHGWAFSKLLPKREFFKTLRAFIMLVFYSDKRVWEYIGYDPDPHLKQRIQMRKDLLAQEQKREEDHNSEQEVREGSEKKTQGIRYKV